MKPLQVYLSEQQYSILREAAVRYGRPMTDLVRELIEAHLMPAGPPPTDISDLVGAADIGRPTNVAEERDRMLEEVLVDLRGHERSVRHPRPE